MVDMFKFEDAVEFLENHPALNSESYTFFSSNIAWHVSQQCKNKVEKEKFISAEKVHVIVCDGDKNFDFFKKKYGDKDDTDHVYVPYRDIYGCEWEYKKHVYYGSYHLFKYNKEYHFKNCPELTYPKWNAFDRYDAGSQYAECFEEMIIEIADAVKEKFGDVKYDDFYTEAERENHKTHDPFWFKDVGNGMSEMMDNKDYIRVTDAQLNIRWWDEWFKKTKLYKDKYDWTDKTETCFGDNKE